jgi:hypothetical protein
VIFNFNLQAVSFPFPTDAFQLWGTSDPDVVVTEVEVVLSMDCYVPYRPRVTTTLPPFPGRNKEMLQRHLRLQGVSPVSTQCQKEAEYARPLLPDPAHYPADSRTQSLHIIAQIFFRGALLRPIVLRNKFFDTKVDETGH